MHLPSTSLIDQQVADALAICGSKVKKLVVAVSGGADSLALLNTLIKQKHFLGLELHGAHLNHGIRGHTADDDAKFVANIFKNVGIPHTIDKVDVISHRKVNSLSLEEAARNLRYSFLTSVLKDQDADAIALGHTRDDQVETILMNIVRGSGLTGLCGMKANSVRNIDGHNVHILRPLLEASRHDTEQYCDSIGLTPRVDESNQSAEYTRNRVRAELIPLLEQFNPAFKNAMLRLSQISTRQVSYLDMEVDRIWNDVLYVHDDYISLNRSAINSLDVSLLSHLLRRALSTVKKNLDGINLQHIDNVIKILDGPSGRVSHIGAGLTVYVNYNQVIIATTKSNLPNLPRLDSEYSLKVPGKTTITGWQIITRIVKKGNVTLTQQLGNLSDGQTEIKAMLSRHSLNKQIKIRTRRPGDKLQPLGMSGHKKLQDFMVDAKIPRKWRDRVPLIVTPRGIAWVVGWQIANWARVTPDDDELIEFQLKKI